MNKKAKHIILISLISIISVTVHAHLEEQLSKVKEYLKNIAHPRLILGVANTPELNYHWKSGEPFISNPNDILANEVQDPTQLPQRTLTLDFNNLDQLALAAKELPNTFDVITMDLSTIKFSKFNDQHFAAFRQMLKKGGHLILPLDGDTGLILYKRETKDEIFEKAKEEALKTKRFEVGQPPFPLLPNIIPDEIAEKLKVDEKEIEAAIALHEKLPLIFGEDFYSLTGSEQQSLEKELETHGIDITEADDLSNEILQDRDKLKEYVKEKLQDKKEAHIRNLWSEEFYNKILIPILVERVKNIFVGGKVTIQKNISMPQPYRRKPEYTDYVLTATK